MSKIERDIYIVTQHPYRKRNYVSAIYIYIYYYIIHTLIFLVKLRRFLLFRYLSILSFFSSGLYRHALVIPSIMLLLSLASGLSDLWLRCTKFIPYHNNILSLFTKKFTVTARMCIIIIIFYLQESSQLLTHR